MIDYLLVEAASISETEILTLSEMWPILYKNDIFDVGRRGYSIVQLVLTIQEIVTIRF